ncbi:peptidase domain-containing ABC transporter [Stenotrophomonas cyclobalanopsidis]|uniref:peptidase domain-containing ABC transporter n=1 Tax=Stenotrophomonas cyclobalanopsidis TaxID=2771362 RepID=UPI0034616C9C
MKTFNQSAAAECGLACIAMVASAHENFIGLSGLRQRFPLSLKGARLGDLIRISQRIGLAARPLRVELDEIQRLRLPCILHWDMNHFVVLEKTSASGFTIRDPASGEAKLRVREFSKHFTGVALELTPTEDFIREPAAPSISIRKLTGALAGLKAALFQILSLSFAVQIFAIIAPFMMQWVVDHVLVAADNDLLTILVLGFSLALLLQIAIGQLRAWCVINMSAVLGLQWSGNVFSHLLRLPLSFFENRHLGDITSRLSSVQSIQRTLTTNFVEAVVDGLMSIATLVLMLLYNWRLAFLTVSALLIYLVVRWMAYESLRRRTEQYMVSAARQESHLLESIRGIQSLKVSGEEPRRRSAYENLMHDSVNHETKLARLAQSFSGVSQGLFGLERILVIWLGAGLALHSIFSAGMLVAYLAYRDQFSARVAGLVDRFVDFKMLALHAERLSDIVLSEPEPHAATGEFVLDMSCAIQAKGVCFRYAEGEPWVIKDCDFSVSAGEAVAIVGESGCGKTTLVKILAGLLAPTEGSLLIGGKDISHLGLHNLRPLVGSVMQDDHLFAGSILENISFFDPEFDLDRVHLAAQMAVIDGDIAAMPMGYQTLIGDMGSSLSGGQRQRVLLARALYRNPRLLILDEATSHLDVLKERLVNEAIKKLSVTRIFVAHRPETVASADRVLVMEGGRVVHEFRQGGGRCRVRGSILEILIEDFLASLFLFAIVWGADAEKVEWSSQDHCKRMWRRLFLFQHGPVFAYRRPHHGGCTRHLSHLELPAYLRNGRSVEHLLIGRRQGTLR